MRRNLFCLFLLAEAAICIICNCVKLNVSGALPAIMAFPFAQIGALLRALSLSGGIWNAAALVVYIALSLLPVALILYICKKRTLRAEDSLLAVLSILLFVALYLMINPGEMTRYLGEAAGGLGRPLLGGSIYAVVIGYAVLRALRHFFTANVNALQTYLKGLLYALVAVFVFAICGVCFGDLMRAFADLTEGNVGNEQFLGASYVFLALQYAVDMLPYGMDIWVSFMAIHLLHQCAKGRYVQETVLAAERLARVCGYTLAATVTSHIAFNLLQLVFARYLWVVNGSAQIPLLSTAFVLAAFLFARYIRDGRSLKEDNDLFI